MDYISRGFISDCLRKTRSKPRVVLKPREFSFSSLFEICNVIDAWSNLW